MPGKFTVYQMKKAMRRNGDTANRKEEKFFERLINATLLYNKIPFIPRPQLVVHITDFGYEPKIDIAYFINGKKIAIEVDGPYHESYQQTLSDKYRDRKLAEMGWYVHRIKEYRYEPVFRGQFDLETLREINREIFRELEHLFLWKKKLSNNNLTKIRYT